MTTKLIRIPLAWPIGTRSGTVTTKDPYIFNGMLESYGDKHYVVKRPGTILQDVFGDGDPDNLDQGIFFWNGSFWAVVDDTLYRSAGAVFVGTTGSNFTDLTTSTEPQWAATQSMGSCVFKNRMFLIGGVTTSAGIWSSVDGRTWVVNAGGQPWGFRSHPGVVVFNEQIFVLGGYNITLASTFNDVWSTPDGTNWTQISADGAPGVWNTRTNHCCIASNNGIYVFAGEDTAGPTFYNDVWYSADGISWAQLTTAASWTARANASCYWFNNKLWIVGGLDSGGTALNDAWYSPDGITWTQSTAAAFASGRYAMYSTVYRSRMWAIGGIDNSSARLPDVYDSADGITWTLVTNGPGFSARADGACLPFRAPPDVSQYGYQTLYIIGGDNGSITLRESWMGALDVSLGTSFGLTIDPSNLGESFQFATYINGQLLLFKNESSLWVIQSGEIIPVTDDNYPVITVPGLVVLNAFAYVMTPSGEIHNCKLENPFEWPALDFVTADYSDDIAIALAKHLNYVVALSQYSTQFFYDNGANQPVGSPLAPYINANLNVGCVSADSVVNVDNSLFWVALTRGGGRTVVRLDGLQLTTVSTPYIDRILMVTQDGFFQAMNYSTDGHQFYIVKTGESTALVYDLSYREWYEWDTFPYVDALDNGVTAGIFLWAGFGGVLTQSGPPYVSDYIDGDYPFFCQTDKVDFGNTALKFCGRAVLVGDRSDATPSITYSDDDYGTYTDAGTVDMQLQRPYLTRLGSFRRRAWKPVQTDANPARWEALEIEYNQGES